MRKNCSKNILLAILTLLFIASVATAIYLLVKTDQRLVKLDKYSEFLELCNTETHDKDFLITCTGLLQNISTSEEQVSCFNIQIITKENTLKTAIICEPNENFQYSNEVLNYKKLLPVEIILSYNPTEFENSYQLSNISLSQLNGQYLQNIVNQDIQTLVKEVPVTIKNSVDFCPAPQSLPDYVTAENKKIYTEYYNDNILSQDEYKEIYAQEFQILFLDNWTNPTINIFFGKESSSRLGYTSLFNKTIPSAYQDLALNNVSSFVPDWTVTQNTANDLISLKNISLVYDGIFYASEHMNYTSGHIINQLFQFLSDMQGNQNVYCSEAKLLQLFEQSSNTQNQVATVNTLLEQNTENLSPACTEILDRELYDKVGIYLKSFYTIGNNTPFTIYEKCNNLYLLINE